MSRTVGVEEEFLLLRHSRPELVAAGEAVVRSAMRRSNGQFEHELKQEQAELGSDPCERLADLADQLRRRRTELASSARSHEARLGALATYPAPASTTPTADERYARMGEEFGQVVAAQLTCGMHVHVSIDSAEEGVGAIDRMRSWLPVLRALSANSPFWAGQDTRYASYRSLLWNQWPTAGPTELFGDHAGYRQVVEELMTSGAAMDPGMIYFDARLSANYPTVEIRVADVCPYVEDAVTLGGLARALVSTAAQEWADGRPPIPVRGELLRAATWRAARWGMEDRLLDLEVTALVPAWALVDRLLGWVGPALQATGDHSLVASGLQRIRDRGTGSALQRRIWAETGSLDAVVDELAIQTVAG